MEAPPAASRDVSSSDPSAGKDVVLTRTTIEPDAEALLDAPLRIEIEIRALKSIPNARWEASVLLPL
jgi:hypothetical protein